MNGSIFYYVSGHGFGHATRSAEIIRSINEKRPDIPVHIRTSADHRIFYEMCNPASCTTGEYDVGVVQTDGLTMDIPATLHAYRNLLDERPTVVARETKAARDRAVRLVVTDIPPVAMRIADALDVPGVLTGNFTWDWIYESWVSEYPEAKYLARRIHEDYQRSVAVFRMPFSPEFKGFRKVIDIPLVGRKARVPRDTIRNLLNLPPDSPLILLSFGGMGLDSGNLAGLKTMNQFTFISQTPGYPGIVIDTRQMKKHGLHYPDLVGASDVVVSKPGYGIVSECAANGVRMLYTDRGPFREYDVIEPEMKNWICCDYMERQVFDSGNWQTYIERILDRPSPEPVEANGADRLADHLVTLFEGKDV